MPYLTCLAIPALPDQPFLFSSVVLRLQYRMFISGTRVEVHLKKKMGFLSASYNGIKIVKIFRF